MAATHREGVQHLPRKLRDIDFLQPCRRRLAHEFACPAIVQRVQAIPCGCHQVLAGGRGILRLHQPVGQCARRIKTADLVEQLRSAQEVVADKTRQIFANTVLVLRNDGGVGNRQAEGVAKQRHHRKPVGYSPHHRSF